MALHMCCWKYMLSFCSLVCWKIAFTKWKHCPCALWVSMLLVISCANEQKMYWCYTGGTLLSSESSWGITCGCGNVWCSFWTCFKVGSVVRKLMFSKYSAIITGTGKEPEMLGLWCAGHVNRTCWSPITFSFAMASITRWFVMASCRCLIAVSRWSMGNNSRSRKWCWKEIVSMILSTLVSCMMALLQQYCDICAT